MRAPRCPTCPTFKELGYPDAEFYIWAGVFAPRGTPEAVLAKLREALRASVNDGEFNEFRKFFEADARRLAEGVRKVGKVESK